MQLPITIAEASKLIAAQELSPVHRKRLIERIGKFDADFLALTLPGCLFSATDYLAAQAARRMLKREMLKTLRSYDVLVTAASGPAPVLAAAAANRAIDHWTHSARHAGYMPIAIERESPAPSSPIR